MLRLWETNAAHGIRFKGQPHEYRYTIVTYFTCYFLAHHIQFEPNYKYLFTYITGTPTKPKRRNRTARSSAEEADDVASTAANLCVDDDRPANPSGNEEREGILLVYIC